MIVIIKIIMIIIILIIVIVIMIITIKITVSQNNWTRKQRLFMLIKTISKERFKTMLPINLSFPKFSISSTFVSYRKLLNVCEIVSVFLVF